jgi:EspG family
MVSEWRLSAVEFDVLWRELRLGEPPYPFDIPSPGTTYEERAEIVATVTAALAARGLTGGDGAPVRELSDAMHLLASSEVTIDGRLMLDERIGLAAARVADRAVIILQRRERLVVRAMAGPRLVAALTELLPPTPPARGQSLRLTYEALTGALTRLGESGSIWEFGQALKDAGIPGIRGQDIRWLAALMNAKNSNGAQFGVTMRRSDGGKQRRGLLSWYATEDGGVVIQRQQGGDWVTITPGNPAHVVARLSDMALMARPGEEPPMV